MIDLWYLVDADVPDDAIERYRALLAPEERARMERYVFDRDRREYLLTRALVRTVLSSYAPEIAPPAWRFGKNEYDRPHVAPGLPPLPFNLSNSNGLILCGVSQAGEVGVDVEPFSRGQTIHDMRHTVFSSLELADLERLSSADKLARAVALWTAKESYIKARAMGMSLPLQEFSILFEGPTRARAIAFHGIDDLPERWQLSHVDLLPTHLAAVCAERTGPARELVLRRTVPLAAIGRTD